MKEVLTSFAVVSLLAGMTCSAQAPLSTEIDGMVRDLHGVPQMGAVIELLGPHAVTVARAFTDDHGRYTLKGVAPGIYQLRASAAFLLPASRSNLRLRPGAQTLADLTMTAIFEAASWLPTETRKANASSDDWRWTLRSTANRPLLRLDGPEPPTQRADSSSHEDPAAAAASEGQVSLLAGDGTFGEGGVRQIVALDRRRTEGSSSALRINLGQPTVAGASASVMVAAGLERRHPLGGGSRLLMSFEAHPELQAGSSGGMQVWRSATTETITLGDLVEIDAGTLLTAERLLGTRLRSAPYLRVGIKPSPGMTVEYKLATDRALQASSDLDDMALQEEALADVHGRPIIRKALHQELSLQQAADRDTVAVAVYEDSLPLEELRGGGTGEMVDTQDFAALPVLADPSTGTLRLAAPGYRGAGIRVAWDHVFSPALSACFEGEVGSALEARGAELHAEELASGIQPHRAEALSGAVRLAVQRTRTSMDVRYRWQNRGTLTQVDEFDTAPQSAFLGVSFRQRLWSGRQLRGLNAVVEATNLLAQGYVPLLGPDGQSLYLTQVSRSVQGGLTFRF